MPSDATQLSQEERLIVSIAAAACFSLRVGGPSASSTDVETYVELLLKLFQQKPYAETGMKTTPTIHDAVAFCAGQLATCAPEQAAALQAALDRRNAI
jgi:hypothetical protein